tara:strand:- start:1147 stop:1470 length:324 start_codon:yes stop_codon:yes gene_type:complete
MNYTPDEDNILRGLVKMSFEERKEISKKIANRPKTPRRINKSKRTVSIAKQPVVIPDTKEDMKDVSVRKKKSGKKKTPNKGLYICHLCEKTYKTKKGVIKHIKKCSS